MKKFVIALSALAALSTAALAERNWDIDNPPAGMEFVKKHSTAVDKDVRALTVVQPTAQSSFVYGIDTPSGTNTGSGSSNR